MSMTGTLMRNTAPHQKCARISPPNSGPMAAPAEKLATQMPIANARSCGSRNMLRISESVDGASVAAGEALQARARRSASRRWSRRRRSTEVSAEGGGADQQYAAAADAVAERAHGDQRAGDHEAVDVDDPQQPAALGFRSAVICGTAR